VGAIPKTQKSGLPGPFQKLKNQDFAVLKEHFESMLRKGL